MPPARITLHFDPAAPASDRAIVSGGVDHAVRYLQAEAGFRGVDVEVFMYVLPQRLAQALEDADADLPIGAELLSVRLQMTASETLPGIIVIDPTSRAWLQQSDLNRFRIAAHEYFHAVQFSLMGEAVSDRVFSAPIGQDRAEGPNWLLEGSAEYVSWKALEAAGLASLDDYLAANPISPGADLQALETPLGFATSDDASLILPLTAVRALLADGSPEPLLAFYRALGSGQPWRAAFTSAFGRSVEDFYAEF